VDQTEHYTRLGGDAWYTTAHEEIKLSIWKYEIEDIATMYERINKL